MSFWSGETIKDKLDDLIRKSDGSSADPSNIDCCAYTLTVGPEVYITPSIKNSDPKGHRKLLLDKKEHFQIPTGQFAYLLTDEYISVPDDAIAFISMKANAKFKGLVNVSGFHVDPGWDGRLIFSVFNAGPNNITLAQGEPLFLIWYSGLDQRTKYKKENTKQDEISTKVAAYIDGEVYSPVVVKDKISELEKLIHEVEHRIRLYIGGLLVILLLGISVRTWFFSPEQAIATVIEQKEVETKEVDQKEESKVGRSILNKNKQNNHH